MSTTLVMSLLIGLAIVQDPPRDPTVGLGQSIEQEKPHPAAGAIIMKGPPYDLSKDKVLYCVGYAHLDTQWRWDFATTIDQYIRDTLEDNFALIEKYPEYVFNFTGSVRYEMMKEYYPELYERLKGYIRDGRWFVSGSSVDEGDVNVPSAEAIIRQVLYGNQFFRREFGKESVDFMLPDCFGFPASMPSIWAHCGLIGFSTQKLTWGSAVGIPFKVGVWEGLDGNSIIAALDPGPYVGAIKGRVDQNADWLARINNHGEKYGMFADYHYYGTGDQGGAPKDSDVANYIASINQPDSQFQVALVSSDQLYKDITAEQRARLPRYKGDMLLTEHSAGTLSSQAFMKRMNRKNELLADAAERAAVVAHWLGGAEYPREKLYNSWVRLLANQMHDILPGTSIPRAYNYSWNDEIVAANGFAAVLTDSVGAVARALDTNVQGVPLIVYNPLSIEREDLVEAEVMFEGGAPKNVRVLDPEGREVPDQIVARGENSLTIVFPARVPSISFSVFEVQRVDSHEMIQDALEFSERWIQNEYYRVTLNDDGDVISIFDRKVERELLSAPHRLVFTHERPRNWPAWNMDWRDRQRPPLDYVKGPAKIRVVENGPVRVALEVEREARGSIIRQQIRLAAGEAGRRVEFKTEIDWQSTSCALRASFPLTVSNPMATYNWEMGTIERGNVEPTRYEVPSHQWFDLTEPSRDGSGQSRDRKVEDSPWRGAGSGGMPSEEPLADARGSVKNDRYGVSILEDCKFGSDKPSDNELRLTLLYTPGVRGSYRDQHSQDWGRHEMVYAIYGHSGDWRNGSEWQSRRLNQPLLSFQYEPRTSVRADSNASDQSRDRKEAGSDDFRNLVHAESKSDTILGKQYSFLSTNTDQVAVRALKLAESDQNLIIRLQELAGRPVEKVVIEFNQELDEIADLIEVDGQERNIGQPTFADEGSVALSFAPFRPHSYRIRDWSPENHPEIYDSVHEYPSGPGDRRPYVSLPMDTDVVSGDANRSDGRFDAEGRTMPMEMLPSEIVSESIKFKIGSPTDGANQAVSCMGQTIDLPSGDFNRLYFLAAADEDTNGTFAVDGKSHEIGIQSWTGFVGQFDDRIWDKEFEEVDHYCDGKVIGMKTGFIKRDTIAWFATHRHHPTKGNEAYQFSYLYKYSIPIAPGSKTLTLPNNPKIKVFAVTLAANSNDIVRPAAPLYDDFTNRKPVELRYVYPPPVHFDVPAVGVVDQDRKETFEALSMGPPSAADYVDASQGRNLQFRVFDPEEMMPPHRQSGIVNGTFPRLNDGVVARNSDDVERCVWYDNEGRFTLDLNQPVNIDRINTYSWHVGNRAPQIFTLWGSKADVMPNPEVTAKQHEGWDLLGVVNTLDLGQGGIHGTSVHGKDGPLGAYRHLLFFIDDTAPGTFFTEIDVHVAP